MKTTKHKLVFPANTIECPDNCNIRAQRDELVTAGADLMASCQKWAPTIDRSRMRDALRKAGWKT